MTDADRDLKLYSLTLFSNLQGAVTAGMVHLGDALGLYRQLATYDAPVAIAELAERCGLDERWVREWAHNQIAARLLEGDETAVGMSLEARAVLADETHPAFGMGMFHRLPQTMAAIDQVKGSFRTGIGHDYDSHGPEGAAGIERSFEPWNRAFLIPLVLAALDGVVDKLADGAVVADVGCGAGSAVLQMAAAFPASVFTGYDISAHALDLATRHLHDQGLTNASFHDPRHSGLPTDHSLDLVTTFDCIHDMTHPERMIRSIADSLRPDGTWLLVDIKALPTFHDNVTRNPMAALLYGISVLSCMSSALSEPGGAGLGTLGLPEWRARRFAEDAGFTRFQRLDIDHPTNAFYEIRP